MNAAHQSDHRVMIVVDRSGGRPESDRRILAALQMNQHSSGSLVQLVDWAQRATAVRVAASASPISSGSVLTVLAHWLAYRVVFRSGWTVHVDAPGLDPIKVRFNDHAAALAAAQELASAIERDGPQAALATARWSMVPRTTG